jgi:hypothetical protein
MTLAEAGRLMKPSRGGVMRSYSEKNGREDVARRLAEISCCKAAAAVPHAVDRR